MGLDNINHSLTKLNNPKAIKIIIDTRKKAIYLHKKGNVMMRNICCLFRTQLRKTPSFQALLPNVSFFAHLFGPR